jgi:transposase
MGVAIRYALNQWDALGAFLENPNVPLDNNESESALRRVALGRNYAEHRIMRSPRVEELRSAA